MKSTLVTLCVAVLGCAAAPREVHAPLPGNGTAPVRAQNAPAPEVPRGPDTASTLVAAPSAMTRRLDQLRTQLEPRGVRYRGIAAAGFISERGTVTTPFDVPAGECLSIVALGSSGISDLDARIYAPDGELLTEDTQPDPHPTVQLCASEARRVYHVIDAYRGQGAYVVASFATDRHGLDAVARAMGGRPGTATSAGATTTDAERRLAELRAGIAQRGFMPNNDPQIANFPAAGAERVPIAVTPDRCYTLAAFAEGSISDADLSVYDADGEEIARDVRPDRDAFVQICPASAGTLLLEVRARPGPGSVLVQSFEADAASLGGANTLWLGERTAWGASSTPLPESLRTTARSLAAQGYANPTMIANATFAPSESREFRVSVEPGRCSALAVIAGRGLGRMSLLAYDAAGELVARGASQGPATVALVCPALRESLLVRVRAEVGSGDAALQSYPGSPAPPWAAGLDRVALSEALATQVATVQAGWRVEGTPERMRLGSRALRGREYDLAAGTCNRFAVSAGRGLPLVTLTLRDARGQTLLEALGEGTAIVTRCTSTSERVRLEVAVEPAGVGEFDGVVARYVRAAEAASVPTH